MSETLESLRNRAEKAEAEVARLTVAVKSLLPLLWCMDDRCFVCGSLKSEAHAVTCERAVIDKELEAQR